MVLSWNGTTTWGQKWEWIFADHVELKDSKTGEIAMMTYLHSRDTDMNFELEKYNPSLQLSKEQSHEWEDICWECYQSERSIYDKVASNVDDFVSRWLHRWALNHSAYPNIERTLKVREYETLLTETLQAVGADLNLTDEDAAFALVEGGPLYNVIEEWLDDLLETSNIQVSPTENTQVIAGITFEPDEIYILREYFARENNQREASAALSMINEVLRSHENALDRDVADYISQHDKELVEKYTPLVPNYTEETLQWANDNDHGIWRSIYDDLVPHLQAKLSMMSKSDISEE